VRDHRSVPRRQRDEHPPDEQRSKGRTSHNGKNTAVGKNTTGTMRGGVANVQEVSTGHEETRAGTRTNDDSRRGAPTTPLLSTVETTNAGTPRLCGTRTRGPATGTSVTVTVTTPALGRTPSTKGGAEDKTYAATD